MAEASDGREAWHLMQQVRWDVTLISCSLRGGLGAPEIAEQAQMAGLGVRLLALGHPDHGGLCRLRRAEAVGCVQEDVAPEAIARAVQAAVRGESLWTGEQLAQAQRWWDEVGCKVEALTQRERQVLSLVADGLSDRQIARRLGVGARTIQTHVSNILGKLGLETRQQAIVFVLKQVNCNRQEASSPRYCG